MTPVTVAAGSVAGGSGNTGWSAKALFVEPASTSIQHRTKNLTQAVSGGTGLNSAVAQSFTAGVSTSVLSVSIRMYRTGTPTDDLYVTINTNATDRPSATVLGTSANVSAASLSTDTGNGSWITFTFSSPVAITGGTKYWFVVERTGARDTTNYGRCFYTSSGQYASHGLTTRSTSTWSGESGSNDMAFAVTFSLAASRLFVVAQDTSGSPKQHVYASADDGATWTELDAANAPTVTDGTYPFSANLTSGSNVLTAARFSATNTVRARVFNVHDDTWDSTDLSNSDVSTIADNTSPIRVLGDIALSYVLYTSLNDTADIAFTRTDGGSWSGVTVLSATSAERSIIADAVSDAGFHQNIFYDAAADDFTVRSLVHGTATQGTALDIDATVATTEAGHTPAAYEPYLVSGVTRVTAAYIDSNNTINERTASLDVTSASVTFGTQRQVTTSTAYAGGKLSTCAYDGDRYCFASNAAGTSIDYWISSDDTTSNTWSSGGNVASGSGLHLSQALPVDGVGIIVLYQSGSNVVVDWAVDGPGGGAVNDSGTVSVGTIAASGQAVTGTATTTVNATGTIAVGTISATGQAITGAAGVSVAATITPSTITASGQAVSGGYGVSDVATVALGTVAATGQSIAATFDVSVTGAVSAGTVAATGEVIVGTFGQSVVATVAVGAVVATGESVNASTGISLTATVSVGAVAATGESIAAAFGVSDTATVNVGSAAATGETVTASAGGSVVGSVNVGTIVAAGEAVSASTTASAAASIAPGTADATGQSVNATAGGSVVAVVQNGTAIASGVLVTATATISAFGSVSAATNAATGYLITAGSGASVVIDPATLDATGYLVNAYIGGRPPTVFGPLLTATVSAEAVLTGSMSADRLLTATVSAEAVLTGSMSADRLLTATISAQPVLTARLRVNE